MWSPSVTSLKDYLDQASDVILSHFKEEDHSFINDTLRNKKIQLVSCYYVYKPKNNASRTKNKNDDKQVYKFCPLYEGKSTGFHRHMISVVVFSYTETLESMLVDYAVTEMGSLGDYLDAAPQGKSMMGNGITTFLLHVAQCIIFNQPNRVKTILIADALLKSFYSMLGFKVIKEAVNSPNFEEARKQFHYESGKSKEYQKKAIGLQCLQNIPRRVTFIHDNQINLNKHKNVFSHLHDVPTSENWLPKKIY